MLAKNCWKIYKGCENNSMMGLDIVTKKNNVSNAQLKRWVRESLRNGCETIEEINGYLIHRYGIKVKNSKNFEFAGAVRKMIPWIVDILDKKYEDSGKMGKERGEKLSFIVRSKDFLMEMGDGSDKFYKIGHIRVAGAIRRTLQLNGVNIVAFKYNRIGYYEFRALTDDDVLTIEEKSRKNSQKSVCKEMVKIVCHNGINNEDANSLWKDIGFVKNIGNCSFDEKKIESDIQRKKDLLMFGNVKDGMALLFD
jgi:hypothetical protein